MGKFEKSSIEGSSNCINQVCVIKVSYVQVQIIVIRLIKYWYSEYAFFTYVPTRWWDLFFLVKNLLLLFYIKNWSCHFLLFFYKRENKIRNKSLKMIPYFEKACLWKLSQSLGVSYSLWRYQKVAPLKTLK